MLFGLSITTWIALVPRIVALVKFFCAVVVGYSVINRTDPVTTAVKLLEKIKDGIPHPRKFSEWTIEEQNAWFDKTSGLDSDRAKY